MAYDLVIRNGTVVDGTGGPSFRADVGVVGDRIAVLGRIRERGSRDIDAEGRFVAPGFVDGHTHMDAQIFWDPLGTCSCWHGVTTVVMGNCGFTLAPCREDEKDLAMRSLERAEDIARDAMLEGITWQWETYADYLDALDRTPKGINYSGYIGHSALRTYVMGEHAFDGTATDDDLSAMRREVESALRAGAIGFSTSRSPNHETADDRPVASRLASWAEVQSLVGVMTDLGTGVFELAQEQPGDPDGRADYARRITDLAVESGRPVTYVVGSSAAAPDAWKDALALLDDIAAKGGRVTGQVHSREFLSIIGFKVNLPFDRLPGWRELRARPLAEQRAALTDPVRRAALVAEAREGRYGAAIGAEVRPPQYDAIRVLDSAVGPHRTVAEIAAERDADPVDVMIDLDDVYVHHQSGLGVAAFLPVREPHRVLDGRDRRARIAVGRAHRRVLRARRAVLPARQLGPARERCRPAARADDPARAASARRSPTSATRTCAGSPAAGTCSSRACSPTAGRTRSRSRRDRRGSRRGRGSRAHPGAPAVSDAT